MGHGHGPGLGGGGLRPSAQDGKHTPAFLGRCQQCSDVTIHFVFSLLPSSDSKGVTSIHKVLHV